jgi:hypothetical protein
VPTAEQAHMAWWDAAHHAASAGDEREHDRCMAQAEAALEVAFPSRPRPGYRWAA